MTARITILCAALASAVARPALAGPASFTAERLVPALDRDGIIGVEWGDVGNHLDADAGAWLGYAYAPLVLYSSASGSPERVGALVQHRVGASLLGSVTLLDWFKVGLEVPFTIYQARGGGLADAGAQVPDLSAGGLGDVRLVVKTRILRADRYGVDVAFVPTLTAPSGVPRDSYLGERGVTFAPGLAISRAVGDLRVAANLGYKLRQKTTVLDLDVGPEVTYALGAALRMARDGAHPFDLMATLTGATGASSPFSRFNESPLELDLGASVEPLAGWQVFGGAGLGIVAGYGTPDARVFAGLRWAPRERDRDGDHVPDSLDKCPKVPEDADGFEDADGCPDPDNDKDGIPDVRDRCPNDPEDKDGFEDDDGCPDLDNDGDGIPDAVDKCPNEPEDKDGYKDEDGCPDPDNDGDGIADAVDKCPDQAEDKDGFEDDDGCPDPDNDHDGILDAVDKCPLVPETINGVDDEDGCPDKGPPAVELTATKIEIRDRVYFDTGKATIQARSHNLLGQVASTLKANRQITKLRIEGHTDDVGNDVLNVKLSQGRADAVRAFLIGRGIDPTVLEAVGYGKGRPVASNKNARGREMNRRVEFVILEIEGKPVGDKDRS